MSDIVVVKIGGSTLGAHDTTLDDLVTLQREGVAVVVVHGGGPQATAWLKIHGAGTQFVRGLRVTDSESLEVVVAVLAGLVNKQLVGAINARGGRAAGIAGVDGSTIVADVRDPEYGRVGQVREVRTELPHALLNAGFLPVISSIGLDADAPSPAESLLNINADTVAGEIAAALAAQRMVFLTDVAGVKGADGAVIARLTAAGARDLIAAGIVDGGMIPKVEACLRAAGAGAATHIVDGREAHALLRVVREVEMGTRVG